MRTPIVLVAVVGLASCAAPNRTAAPPPATPVANAAGVSRSCIALSNIAEARVIDDKTIDFHQRGGGVLRNTLPYGCPQLGFEKAFSYATSLSQLCSTDIITVIVQGAGPSRGASCGLGQFVPQAVAAR